MGLSELKISEVLSYSGIANVRCVRVDRSSSIDFAQLLLQLRESQAHIAEIDDFQVLADKKILTFLARITDRKSVV